MINKSLSHICFPTKEPTKRRSPVSLGNIEKMYESVGETSNSTFVQKRNRVILKLLEITGARVGGNSLTKFK